MKFFTEITSATAFPFFLNELSGEMAVWILRLGIILAGVAFLLLSLHFLKKEV